MPMPKEFLALANSFRCKDASTKKPILDNKKSKYNSKKLKNDCELCGKSGDDIHHMIPQNKADENGFIGSVHKNHKANLMNICKDCHEKVTKNNIIHKRVKTSNGRTFIEINL
jgi:DNA mismatch repair protein MutS